MLRVQPTPGALQAALDSLASQRVKECSGPLHIRLLSGTHYLREPLTFTKEHSGTAECPVVCSGEDGAVISGGVPLTGWRMDPYGSHAWVTEVNLTTLPYFHQLHVNGGRRPRARAPNVNDGFFRWARYSPNGTGLEFYAGDIPAAGYRQLDDVEVVAFQSYFTERHGVAAIDSEKRTLTYTNRGNPLGRFHANTTSRYWVENAAELLDAPGEWYLDRSSGVVRYLPITPWEELQNVSVVASVASSLLIVDGAEHLSFESLTFAHSEGWVRVAEYGEDQAALQEARAAVHVRGGSHHVSFRRVLVTGCAAHGVWIYGNASDVELHECEISDTGAGGVHIGEGSAGGPPTATAHVSRVLVNSSTIREGGNVSLGAAGIMAHANADHLWVHRNEVRDFHWSGISMGQVSSWGYSDESCDRLLRRFNVVSQNLVHRIGLSPYALSDNGAIYAPAVDLLVEKNILRHVSCYDFGGFGIYSEGGGCNNTYRNNVIYATAGSVFAPHALTRHLTLSNNVLVGELAGPHLHHAGLFHSFGGMTRASLIRNIMVLEAGGLFVGRFNATSEHKHGHNLTINSSWSLVDRNLY
jgi:hypothetical protein